MDEKKKLNMYCVMCGEQLVLLKNSDGTFQAGCEKCNQASHPCENPGEAIVKWMDAMCRWTKANMDTVQVCSKINFQEARKSIKCVCGYEGDDFTWLPLLEVCVPDYMATEETLARQEQIEKQEKELGTPLPKGELKRCFACPKCGTLRIDVKKE